MRIRFTSLWIRVSLQATIQPSLTWNAAGIIAPSPGLLAVLGHDGTTFCDVGLVHPDDLRELRLRTAAGSVGARLVVRLRHLQGHWLSFLLSESADQPGEGLRANALDVSWLIAEKEGLESAQKIAQLGHWTFDPLNGRLSWSEEIFRIFEIDSSQSVATLEVFRDRVHPDDRALVDRAYNEHLQTKVTYDLSHRLLFPDGRVKYVRERCETRRDAAGNPLLSLGTVHDVTSSMLNQEAFKTSHKLLEDSLASLTQSRAILQSVIDTVPHRIFWKDRQGVYLGCNTLFAHDAGKASPAEVVGRTDYDLAWSNEAELYRADDRRVLDSGVPRLRYEEPQTTVGGDRIWLRTSKVPLRSTPGEADAILGIYEDITREKLAQDDLRAAMSATEKASKAKGEFLAHMSHEIRTPMNAVLGFAELALTEAPPEPVHGYLRNIEDAATNLLGVINDILDFSKIEAGMLHLEQSAFSLAGCLRRAQVVGETLVREKDVVVRLVTAPGLPEQVQGDAFRLTQVLTNLVGNAAKFTPAGLLEIRASPLESAPGRARFKLEVADTGIGMSASQVTSIFEPFTQADSSTTRLFGGTGLGLTITRELLKLMGGAITVTSVVGQGTTFTVTLDLPIVLGVAPTAPEVKNYSGAFKGKRALLAEDNRVNQILAMAMLTRMGFQVDVAENGRRAVEMVHAAMPAYDIVFMDMQMPELDGLGATRQIRQLFQREALPIIAMTANAFLQDREACLAAGMNEHIAKPMRAAAVGEVISGMFARCATAA